MSDEGDGRWLTYSPEHLRTGDKILIVDDIFDTGKTVNELSDIILRKGIPREDIKIAVYDYKVRYTRILRRFLSSLITTAESMCCIAVEDEVWIHYMCHEFVGLTSEEIDEQYTIPKCERSSTRFAEISSRVSARLGLGQAV
jgi:hypoxanthine phosphoribosyltransferase